MTRPGGEKNHSESGARSCASSSQDGHLNFHDVLDCMSGRGHGVVYDNDWLFHSDPTVCPCSLNSNGLK